MTQKKRKKAWCDVWNARWQAKKKACQHAFDKESDIECTNNNKHL